MSIVSCLQLCFLQIRVGLNQRLVLRESRVTDLSVLSELVDRRSLYSSFMRVHDGQRTRTTAASATLQGAMHRHR